MIPEEKYRGILTQQPPADLQSFAASRMALREYLTYKCISRADADAYSDMVLPQNDFRSGSCARTVYLWCSACDEVGLAEYLPAIPDRHHGASGVRLWREGEAAEYRDDEDITCPMCGAKVQLCSRSGMRYGRSQEMWVTVPSLQNGMLALTEYFCRRTVWASESAWSFATAWCYVADGRKIVKISRYRRGMSGALYSLDEWQQQKRLCDTMGPVTLYDRDLPDLEGTSLENSRLWEYARKASADFLPVSYIRLYWQHPNAENLIANGAARLVGEGLRAEGSATSYYNATAVYTMPRLGWVDWKQNRPAQMLGLTKDQLRTVLQLGWKLRELKFWHKARQTHTFGEVCEMLQLTSVNEIDTALTLTEHPLRLLRYCKAQRSNVYFYKDYCHMAAKAGFAMEDAAVLWPKDLRAAHDRAMAASRYAKTAKYAEAFAAMTRRCRALNWVQGDICIRVAETPVELVDEGATLHHCVGGYARAHAEGNIILFIRHTRRPERSWFTLNVDVKAKKILQNHGYGNEFAHGKVLHIPQAVQDFVKDWKKQVLDNWQLPPEKKPNPKAPAGRPAA